MNHFCRYWRTVPTSRWLTLVLLVLPVHAARAQTTLVLQPASNVFTLAGTGVDGAVKAGIGVQSPLGTPRALAYDTAGSLYIADARNHQVLRVDTAGKLTVLAGTGHQGFAGDGGSATAAELNTPSGIVADSLGNVFIADSGNGRVRRIAAADGTITTIAGSGVAGFSGDGGPAVAAAMRAPGALAIDNSSGALYIADSGNHRVRKLLSNGTIATIAGDGQEGDAGDGSAALAASFGTVFGLAVATSGQLLIADTEARRVRALNADGTVTAYSMGSLPVRRPAGLAATSSTVYLADAALQSIGAAGADGASTLVGSGEQGSFHAGGPLQTPLDTPSAVAPGLQGTLAIADAHNHQVQQVQAAALDFGTIPTGSQSAAQSVTLTNGGKSALTVTALQVPVGFATFASNTTCTAVPFTLQPGGSCGIAILFAPTVQGAANALAQVRFTGGAPQSLLLRGTGSSSGSLAASSTSLRSDGTIAYAGATVSLAASVSGQSLASPAGNVTFMDGTAPLATVPLTSGTAALSTASLTTGPHSLRAVYAGDAVYSTSTSAAVTVTMVPSPDFTLSAGAASYSGQAGASMTVPLTLLPINGTLNQPVQIAVSGLPSGAKAAFNPSTFVLGGTGTTVSLLIQLPTTLADAGRHRLPTLPYAALLLPLLCLRRQRRLHLLFAVCLTAAALSLDGCGSGFKPGVTQADLTSTTKSYTAVVTATTTGVLGSPLAHSTPVGLVISK